MAEAICDCKCSVGGGQHLSSHSRLLQAAMGFQFSERCVCALQGGSFDARHFVAKPRKQSDEAGEVAERVFRSKVKILDILAQRPDVVDSVLSFAEGKVMKEGGGEKTSLKDYFPATYTKLGKVPKKWKADWLAKHTPLSEAQLGSMDSADASLLSEVFEFATATTDKMSLPREMLWKAAASQAFLDRYKSCGERLGKEFIESICEVSGAMDWSKAGCYTIIMQGGKAMLQHCSGCAVRPCIALYGIHQSIHPLKQTHSRK